MIVNIYIDIFIYILLCKFVSLLLCCINFLFSVPNEILVKIYIYIAVQVCHYYVVLVISWLCIDFYVLCCILLLNCPAF